MRRCRAPRGRRRDERQGTAYGARRIARAGDIRCWRNASSGTATQRLSFQRGSLRGRRSPFSQLLWVGLGLAGGNGRWLAGRIFDEMHGKNERQRDAEREVEIAGRLARRLAAEVVEQVAGQGEQRTDDEQA